MLYVKGCDVLTSPYFLVKPPYSCNSYINKLQCYDILRFLIAALSVNPSGKFRGFAI